jgi:putative Mg2+ transporter-C (MgtC) family protein
MGKAAGLRTHMLVALGAALFVLAPLEAGMTVADASRVIQGIVAGIGFLGAGAILKIIERREVEGLTTAAGIWFTAAVGTAVGTGQLWVPIVGTSLAWIVMSALRRVESRIDPPESRLQDGEPKIEGGASKRIDRRSDGARDGGT